MAAMEIQQENQQKKSFVANLANKGSLPVAIIRSTQNDRRCYFVVLFKSNFGMEKINSDSKQPNKSINLSDYGVIIAKGYGENPSDKDKLAIMDQYGIDIEKLF